MSLQIVAVKEDVGFNRPQLGNVSFNTSNQVVYIVDEQTRQFLYLRDAVPSRFTAPFTPADQRYEIWISWYMGPQILETALTRKTRDSQIRRRSNTMHQSKGHSSYLVLTIRKLNLWELTRVALITLHYRQCSTQSHGLHTIPSPVASNNAACPRRNIANQDSWLTIGCGHPLVA
ncbi:hypothetical protein PCH_Pc22g26300 [Penicillium rubens Wisconsin 54-1255]|uniref:Uncharacterized protein n=1 Tax=Penicillium rubens (strain ATCC 28089 / DSM 1075 / NRRL 1951 / Wisconsin 54-1255) TaxID=500485 RepID=B6HTT7_PENRW|nr:hypothetical protein PCH_Pc22g26300 [Penicillium rubens Wisconsin 54-1255]